MKTKEISAVINKPKAVLDAYNDLSNRKKGVLKGEFMSELGYKNFDSLYKKLHGDSPFWPNEKIWLSEKLGSIELEFPI